MMRGWYLMIKKIDRISCLNYISSNEILFVSNSKKVINKA